MSNSRKQSTERLFSIYMAIVEYMNDSQIESTASLIVMAFQTLVIVFDIMEKLYRDSIVLRGIEYIGVTPFLKQIVAEKGQYSTLVLLLIILVLSLQVILVLVVHLILAWSGAAFRNPKEIHLYLEESLYFKPLRSFLSVYQYIYLPVATSLAVYCTQSNSGGKLQEIILYCGVVTLVICPIVYLIGEYHFLEVQPDQGTLYALVRKNLTSSLIDTTLVYSILIISNLTNETMALVCGFIGFMLRLLLSIYMPFYQDSIRKVHNYLQGLGILAFASMFVGFFLSEPFIVLIVDVLLACILWWLMFDERGTDYAAIATIQLTKLGEVQKMFQEGRLGAVYKELLILEKQTSSHRELLTIEVMKRRCVNTEEAWKGGSKILTVEDLMTYQRNLQGVITNFVRLADRSISILKFMSYKEPACEIFLEEISALVATIESTESLIGHMLKANRKSTEAIELAGLLCGYVINDNGYLKLIQEYSVRHIESVAQKKERKKLFNGHSGVIFTNLTEELGKITRASKNMTKVLGHNFNDLVGMNISQLIPISLRQQHTRLISRFVDTYSKKDHRKNKQSIVDFYAYNRDGHLTAVHLNYYFNFSPVSFELCGLVKQVPVDYPVVLVDSAGQLQGWTSDLGSIFQLDKFSQADCMQYNFFVLLPAMVKHLPKEKLVEVKTFFFVPRKLKCTSLRIRERRSDSASNSGRESGSGRSECSNIDDRVIREFENLLHNDGLEDIRLVHIKMTPLSFGEMPVRFNKIEFKRIESLENPDSVIQMVRKRQSSVPTGTVPDATNSLSQNSSYFRNSQISRNKIPYDFNFTLSPQCDFFVNVNLVRTNLVKSLEQTQQHSDDIDAAQIDSRNSSHTLVSTRNIQSSNSAPTLHRMKLGYILVPIVTTLLVLVLYELINVENYSERLRVECEAVMKRNYFYMILGKSAFNPNITYIRKFDGGELVEAADWMLNQRYEYRTGANSTASISKFYLFNVQIPAMLDRLVQTNDFSQLDRNFNGLILEFDSRLTRSLNNWAAEIAQLRTLSIVRLSFICVGSVCYVLYLIFVFFKSKKRNKIVQAFFKFQKCDLEAKTKKIKECIADLEVKAEEWHFHRQFTNAIKTSDLTHLSCTASSILHYEQTTIMFDVKPDRQAKIARKKAISLIIFISVFLFGQVIFVIVYGVLSHNLLSIYSQIPQALDDSCKLIVQPNLQLANLYRPVPSIVTDRYKSILPRVLQTPQQSVPDLFKTLEKAPCEQCPFLFPLLSTNFRSFYSTFAQMIREKEISGDKGITEMYYGVDVVVNQLLKSMRIRETPLVTPTITIYLVTLIIFISEGYFGYRRINKETDRLEIFLKYFDDETLSKNKHLNNIVRKEI